MNVVNNTTQGPVAVVGDTKNLDKLLACGIIAKIVELFNQVSLLGFSSDLMQARAVLLAKIPQRQSTEHARPTIFFLN